AIAEAARAFMLAFPDMQVFLDRVVPQGDHIIFHWTLTGTNAGPGGTGREVRISGFEQWQFGPDGLIATALGHFDVDDYNRQLGQASQTMAHLP
ncbi:MAG: nuclear transport factor 2 family protein, partial [Acidobacteria bacterium]|nr:nuclear transport factor 2 family protein [Acidobacteriota bacterium]